MDTIYALSTAPGKAGVAIVRVSGPAAHEAAQTLCGGLPQPRVASKRDLKGEDGHKIDEAIVLVFEHGSSFTGEDVVELHLHGSTAVVKSVLEQLGKQDDLRSADPGEFTRRSLENGKLDLAQVEGLADLIDAETEAQRRQALRVLSGELGKKAERWRSKLLRAAALLEAAIESASKEHSSRSARLLRGNACQ